MLLKDFIDAAAGRIPADILFINGNIIDLFNGEIIKDNLAVKEGKILGWGDYEAKQTVDLKGAYLAPGFIDAHVHIESSMTTPEFFSSLVVPRGTTTVVADPHEIANVAGLDGIRYMLKASEDIALECLFMLPSCVPATPFENTGALLKAQDLATLADEPRILGLGEMMDFPSLIGASQEVLDKIQMAQKHNMPIDGHAPTVKGKDLNAYIGAGVGTDHECTTLEEMKEHLQRGMMVLIREGSAARNLENLIKGITPSNLSRCAFCTDDKQPEDILNDGHIDHNLRKAVKLGMDPLWAIQMASLNAAQCYGLKNKGALAPGYDADIVILDNLKDFNALKVYKKGNLVAEEKKILQHREPCLSAAVTGSIKLRKIEAEDFQLHLKSEKVRIIGINPQSLVTNHLMGQVKRNAENLFIHSEDQDILKMAVIERYGKTNNIGLGLIKNYGLKGGAIASSIGHDSHNIIVVGDNDQDMALAVNALKESGGGISLVVKGKLEGQLPLPIGGLMSDQPAEKVSEALKDLHNKAQQKLSINPSVDPFMTLAFMALPVIPELKLTDQGLFDVLKFDFIDIEVV